MIEPYMNSTDGQVERWINEQTYERMNTETDGQIGIRKNVTTHIMKNR
jgi:hypothetical protein